MSDLGRLEELMFGMPRRFHIVLLAFAFPVLVSSGAGAAPGGKILYSDWSNARIDQSNLDGSSPGTVLSTGLYPSHVAVDAAGGKLYWTRYSPNEVLRANLDGTNPQTIVSLGEPYPASIYNDIDVDVAGGKFYWADAQRIRRANLDGTTVETISTVAAWYCLGLDLVNSRIYYADGTGNYVRANLDGTGATPLTNLGAACNGLEVDPAGGYVYISTPGGIRRTDLAGDNQMYLQFNGTDHFDLDLDLVGGKIYWVEWITNKIWRMNLDGSNVETIRTAVNPLGIAVVNTSCGDGNLELGEACDDGNETSGDCCSATCTIEADGSPCTDEGNLCTQDLCDAGTCEHLEEPRSDISCYVAPKTKLQLADPTDATKDKLSWSWGGGAAFAQAALGTPLVDTTYALCLYDRTGGSPSLADSFEIAPSSERWTSKDPKGLSYKDKAGSSDGVTKLQIKTGDPGKTKVKLGAKGLGASLPGPATMTQYFAQETSVTAQLVNSIGTCWTTEFEIGDNAKSDQTSFKAQTK